MWLSIENFRKVLQSSIELVKFKWKITDAWNTDRFHKNQHYNLLWLWRKRDPVEKKMHISSNHTANIRIWKMLKINPIMAISLHV